VLLYLSGLSPPPLVISAASPPTSMSLTDGVITSPVAGFTASTERQYRRSTRQRVATKSLYSAVGLELPAANRPLARTSWRTWHRRYWTTTPAVGPSIRPSARCRIGRFSVSWGLQRYTNDDIHDGRSTRTTGEHSQTLSSMKPIVGSSSRNN